MAKNKNRKNISSISKRPPIVTIMGHVDHGKTSILDLIRNTNVQASESGGITQSIGAYQVEVKGQKITFIDTPGHHAFAKMRARGGSIADIVVLVVAANDGVMPQTQEAISHAKSAKAKIIVAINKIDLPNANVNKVKKELADHELNLKEYGGDIPVVETSAIKNIGIDELLNTIIEVSKELDLNVDPNATPSVTIIESFLDGKKGVVAHGIVRTGVLKVRDIIVGGTTYARIRSLTDWRANQLKEAPVGTPVEILGFVEIPEVGVTYSYVPKLKEAQKLVEQAKRELEDQKEYISPQERILQQIRDKEIKDIPIVVKTESKGTLEVVTAEINRINSEEVRFKIIHSGVGNINENDVLLAVPVRGIVIGFNVDIDRKAEDIARRERIITRLYTIIYELLEELTDVVQGELEALEVQVLGVAEVLELFELSDKSIVAGSKVIEGRVRKGNKVLLERNGEVVSESRITSLKIRKEDVGEVTEGNECGIKLGKNVEIHVGDIIKAVSE